MKEYSISDIIYIYNQVIEFANKSAEKKKWLSALEYIEASARWAYSFNWIYADYGSERIIQNVARSTLRSIEVINPNYNKVVLIDSFCWDNRGLTQQYLHAMMHNNMSILYICTSNNVSSGESILQEMNEYGSEVLLFQGEKSNPIEKSERMIEVINRFSPANLFLHILPWDLSALMTCYAIKGVCKYNINLTDHAFWLGASLIDYNLEFRPYGMTVSLEKRGLKKNQCIPLPFYSIEPNDQLFSGIPALPDNSVKILTGGALYKMLGDDDIFFKIMEMLLSISNNVYILVAGFDNSRVFYDKCKNIKGRERIVIIGNRKDINAVFERCDIYLGTYPTSGGLMTHYAARHGKPILAYHDKNDAENAVEELLNHYQNVYSSFTDLNQMKTYAEQLINNSEFRKNEGEVLKKGIVTEERFEKLFKEVTCFHNTLFEWEKDDINYESFCKRYLDLEKSNGFNATKTLIWMLKQKSFKIRGYRRFFFIKLVLLFCINVSTLIRKKIGKLSIFAYCA